VNVTHQKKKLGLEELRQFRDLLELPVSDAELDEAPFYHPGAGSPEVTYMLERRKELGGSLPARRIKSHIELELPKPSLYAEFHEGMKKGEASTTMVFARLLSKLLRDDGIGNRVVPIIPDEARTFGMDALFSQVGIYSSVDSSTSRSTRARYFTIARARMVRFSKRESTKRVVWRRSLRRALHTLFSLSR